MSEIISYINSILTLLFISLNSYILYLILKLLKPTPKPVRKSKPKTKKPVATAKNNTAVNAVHEYQKIQTAEITIPVIAEDVLIYGPGELGAAYPNETKLYYPASAISDKEFLDTIVRSALQVKTHEKNTGEDNRDLDGWPLEAWYDANTKKAMLKGILHGEENVAYAKENLNKPGFGTSAFISFLKLRKEKGIAPNGKEYDVIAEKLVNNHVAILPNIRDPKNVIVALNAVAEEDDESDKEAKNEITNTNEDKPMTQDEFNSMMDTYQAKNKEKDELKNSIKNEILEEMKKGSSEEKTETKNEDGDKPKDEEKPKDDAANSDDEKKEDKDDAEAANALPSDEMLKDFSSHLGITFATKPTLKVLGKTVGVESKNTAELITALNAKRKEIVSGSKETAGEGKNSNESKGSLDSFLNTI